MGLLLVSEGEVATMQALFDLGCSLHLYKNAKAPAKGDTLADYEECDFPGYASKNLLASQWTFAPGEITIATYPAQEFELLEDISPLTQLIHGYYVEQLGTSKLLWAERFLNSEGVATPILVMIAGQGALITPKLRFTGEV